MKIVMLERDNVGADLDLSKFGNLGELTIYGCTKPEEIAGRIRDAEIVILNKMPMNEETMKEALNLKLLCVTATGTDNVDADYCRKRGIEVRNVKGYSTETVVQHTFALLFYLWEQMPYYDHYVKSGEYEKNPLFTHFERHFRDLSGKKWGIVGLGEIGKRVYEVAKAFGAHPVYYSTGHNNNQEGYERVSFDTLLSECDIISVHAPLNENTVGLFDHDAFSKMKNTAYFINVGRGPIADENALVWALNNGEIAGAALDVLSKEPITKDNPLNGIKDSSKLVITPHIAWASIEARYRLMEGVYQNIVDYLNQKTEESVVE